MDTKVIVAAGVAFFMGCTAMFCLLHTDDMTPAQCAIFCELHTDVASYGGYEKPDCRCAGRRSRE